MIRFNSKAITDIKKIVQAAFQKGMITQNTTIGGFDLVFKDLLDTKEAIELLYFDYLVTDNDGNRKSFENKDGKYTIHLAETDLVSLIGDPMIAEEIQFELRDKNRPRTVIPARSGSDIHLVFDEKTIAENADKELYQRGIHERMDYQSPKVIRLDELTDFYIIRLNEEEVTQLTHNPDTFKDFMRVDLWEIPHKKTSRRKSTS